jgi:aminopeptidase N
VKILAWCLLFLFVPSDAASAAPVRAGAVEPRSATESVPAEKKTLPPVNWPRSRKIDVKHLSLDLRFDWTKRQAYGVAAIAFSPFESTNELKLDAAFFKINSVTSGSGAALKFEYEGGDKDNNLKIALERTYHSGDELTVNIDYRTTWVNLTDPTNLNGSNGKGIRFFEPTSNDPIRPREIWSAGDPESNRYWFPGFDSPNDFRTTDVRLTVDKDLVALANGALIERRDNPDGTRTFHWKMDRPYANHLTSFVVGDYVDVQQSVEGVQLHNFGYPNEREAIAATVVRLPDMLRFYSDVTGAKYPYSSYSQVFVQDLPWGLGNNTLATQSENMVDDDRIHAEYFYLWDGLEAETLAHQWFGNYLTCRDWSHVWLNRGFAHYFDGLYNEHKNGREEFLMWQLLGDQSTYLADWDSGVRHPIVTRNYESAATFTGDNYPYSRGSLVLHMLRKHLGEDNWWKAIRHYVKSNANSSVTTEDFSKAVAEATGQQMDWFFDQWLYKMGHPIFEVSKTYDDAKKELTLNVKQTQKVDPDDEYPQVGFFAGKVEVEIDDRLETIWLEPKADNVFRFASQQPPKLVNFDHESTWIKEIKFEKSLDELLYQLENDKDILGKRWAMTELVSIAKLEKTATADKERIYVGFRQSILSGCYWRLRQSALGMLQGLLVPASGTKGADLDQATIAMLLTVIKNQQSWNRAAAISFLGTTRKAEFVDLYLHYLGDESDRVINAAAIALGRSKSPKAFDALAKLVNKPSWKNQSLMSSLVGLKELGDPRGFSIAFRALEDSKLHRWRLPTPPVWDLRVFAVDTIVSLGKGEATFPLIFERFKKSMAENDISGVFNNVVLLNKLGDPRGQEAFDLMRTKFKDDAVTMSAVELYAVQFKEALKKL